MANASINYKAEDIDSFVANLKYMISKPSQLEYMALNSAKVGKNSFRRSITYKRDC